MNINTMDYVRGVEQASGIYAQALHEYSIENTKLERENEKLKAENTKLRELVLYMFDFYCTFREEPHTDLEELKASIEAWKRMQELGIEVES